MIEKEEYIPKYKMDLYKPHLNLEDEPLARLVEKYTPEFLAGQVLAFSEAYWGARHDLKQAKADVFSAGVQGEVDRINLKGIARICESYMEKK